MNFKKYKLLLLTLTAVSVLSFAGCGTAQTSSSETPEASAEASETFSDENAEIPENLGSAPFEKMDTTDLEGNKADSSVFAENKLTLVNVWNVGCTPCIQEIPVFDKLNKEYAEKGVSVKGLYYDFEEGISDDARKEVDRILSEAKADYQQLLASKEMLNTDSLYSLDVFPTTFFVDSNGRIVDTVEGSNDYEGWKNTIEKILKQVENNA